MLSRHIKQEVCPWNAPKLVQVSGEEDYRARGGFELRTSSFELRNDERGSVPADEQVRSTPRSLPGTEAPSLVALMRMSYEEWDAWTRGSAIRRAGYAGFRRNVAVGLGNWLASVDESPAETVEVLREALEDEDPLVREHTVWALGRATGGGESAQGSRGPDDPHRGAGAHDE